MLFAVRRRFPLTLFFLAVLVLAAGPAAAEVFRIGIMQAQKGAADKFAPLEKYLRGQGIDIELVETANYPAAAAMFSEGEVDGMFSGSGVAGAMLIKDVAYPLVRPVSKEGHSTYWAAVIAPKGAPKFNRQADYFKGKRVIYCALASSGEFFFRAVPGADKAAAQLLTAGSHGEAVKALADGRADIAIVKNWVWESVEAKYPGLERVGSDPGQNPDNTLIVSKKADRKVVEKVAKALLTLQGDQSAEAAAVRDRMEIKGYILTSAADFNHTLSMLKKAGVGPDFNFSF